jgi:circadian clock protein KaiC
MNELRRRGATTLITMEETQPGGGEPTDSATLSALADTIINFRLTSQETVRRFIWVGKSRVSRTDLRVREVRLGEHGLEVLEEGTGGT